MRNDGFVFVLFFLLLSIVLQVDRKDEVSNREKSSDLVVVQPVAVDPVLRTVKINYEVEYGSFYTGDQTPVVHYGSEVVVINDHYGIGYGGLPITGYLPVHSQLTLNLSGNKAILFIACGGPIANEPWQPNGLLRVEGAFNSIIMNVRVVSDKDGTILVRADPEIA